ncbi:hypothetical protein Micbo1qcDRAFT_230011 [Microdochium bolleyi]|uniref:Zn(2)-C6 fungal-type domain-containing protein n=1 Tax=Microdochium bolleyi TaxID=196109 RepID=A0A136JJJ8_9PEZI|nr:hypothetical protein Micbo1qcDRAFT_230011 [Microdochium bolleyi]
MDDEVRPPERKRRRSSNKSRVQAAFPRKRATAACQVCRGRKVKCDNQRPSCRACRTAGSACVYPDAAQDHSAFDPASLLILDRLSQVLERLDQRQPATRSACPDDEVQIGQAQHDQLRIPAGRTTPDCVLQWPIMHGRFPSYYLVDAVFEAETVEDSDEGSHGSRLGRLGSVDENAIVGLVHRFLELVHIKNPVLDVDTICAYARRVAEDGLRWDAPSCLVLLAAALACVAQPFGGQSAELSSDNSTGGSLHTQRKLLRDGEAYYNLARRRLGYLQGGILAAQCHFFAGVFLMYTMRPVAASSNFHSASRFCHLHLQHQARRLRWQQSSPMGAEDVQANIRQRRLEQRLYWSCYKSECELRVSILNMPNSSLADYHYPDSHPSPPEEASTSEAELIRLGSAAHDSSQQAAEGSPSPSNPYFSHSAAGSARLSPAIQQQSWFYYLTEITLRRIANRLLHLFYSSSSSPPPPSSVRLDASSTPSCSVAPIELLDGQGNSTDTQWATENIPFMVRATLDLEQQLVEWYRTLPAPIQFDEASIPTEELPYLIRGRVLGIKVDMYLPFLRYFTSSQSSSDIMATEKRQGAPARRSYVSPLPHRDNVLPLVRKAVLLIVNILQVQPLRHRHHGSWMATETTVTLILALIAAARYCEDENGSDGDDLGVPHNWKELIGAAVERLQYWEEESPWIQRAVEVIESYCS